MKPSASVLRDVTVTAVLLALSFAASLLFQNVFGVEEHITTVFVFAVFLISLRTNGYVYGIVAAVLATVAINYAFTFPYFALNFTIPVNLISAIVMIIIAVLTGTITTKLKYHEATKAESERERMRANLLRAVSHDLRTPLTTIYGSGTTLLDRGDSMTEEQKKKLVKGIKEDAEWLIRMVENLLSVTRIDDGRVKLLKTPTVLEELVDSVMLKFKKRFPSVPLKLILPEEMVLIPMDAMLIEQVILNMMENAARHAVGMTELSLSVLLLPGKAVFEIRDNGYGIPQDRLPTLFSGYYGAKELTADSQKKNAGIGLAVCATIVKAHGGEIEGGNSPEGGAVFRFTLDTEEENSVKESV